MGMTYSEWLDASIHKSDNYVITGPRCPSVLGYACVKRDCRIYIIFSSIRISGNGDLANMIQISCACLEECNDIHIPRWSPMIEWNHEPDHMSSHMIDSYKQTIT